MFIPQNNSKNVLKNEIVFTSQINEELSKKYCLTSITNINPSKLLEYVANIIKLNKNVTFYEIAYNPVQEKVYFYTNKEICLTNFIEPKTRHFKLNTVSSLLEAIDTLKSDNYNQPDLVNLDTIFNILHEINYAYLNIKFKYALRFNNLISHLSNKELQIIKYDFHNETLTLGLKNYPDQTIIIKFVHNEPKIISSNNPYANQILFTLKEELLNYYLEISEFAKYQNATATKIRPSNCDFYVDISFNGLDIYSLDNHIKDFELIKLSDGRVFSSGSSKIATEVLKQEASPLLNNIYVQVKDLPDFIQAQIKNQKTDYSLQRTK